ncbi:sal-like protein 1 [Trichonephila inaurata madagascariensis]|uniref:Homeotic protein spalt-major n=1 Tax=Trichonephila inaurata madagascariensis TaxID=2747483 RepID=A0A8X6YJM2_9ARAC|nr:sal-like protein 1 [Trichonephila inaurata madagascariensis]
MRLFRRLRLRLIYSRLIEASGANKNVPNHLRELNLIARLADGLIEKNWLARLMERNRGKMGICPDMGTSRPGSCNEEEEEDGGIGDEHVCGKCRLEFIDLSDFLHHKRSCTRKRLVLVGGEESSDELEDPEEMGVSPMDYKDDPEKYVEDLSTLPYLMSLSRVKSCFPENPALSTTMSDKKPQMYTECEDHPLDIDNFAKSEIYANHSDESIANEIKKGTPPELGSFPTPQALPQYLLMQPVPDTNVTLQALQNTRVAVAQQGAGNTNLSHLALHTALYTLQQQQIIQLHQVIQQLQSQLVGSTSSATNPLISNSPTVGSLTGSAALTPPQSTDGNNGGILALTTTAPSLRTLETVTQAQNLSVTTTATPTSTTCQSSSTTDNTVSVVSAPPPAPPHEPNTLELLQRHTEQALQNTMAGSSFLLNGLSGLGNSSDILRFCKKGDVKKEGGDEAFFRHRCRFCGKVFGSDSALQIHIRSHTGERPFKCNVCGNRFSTKGNLKVHFGRHKEKYPHIKMNPHPVPLHLDNLHPPLEPPDASETPPILTQSSPCQTVAPSLQPPNLIPAQPLPLVTHCHDRSLSSPTGTGPQEISRQSDNDNMQSERRSISPNGASNLSDDSGGSVGEDYATDENGVKDTDQVRYEEDIDNDDDSFSVSPKIEQKETDDNVDDEAKTPTSENNGSTRITTSIPSYVSSSAPTFPYFFHPTLSPPSSVASMCYPPMSTPPLTSTPSSRISYTSNTNNDGNEQIGPSPDPNIYQDLLPKPGSNDNSWESLMEVTKTSETSKLQQLVDNIEHKLSDPNQCLFCHRVLSCKSALQMHYRTHTGERPFKCKICSRAFTTKGNLKTHMGVHRAKSSLQVLHQCPVCHKQFTNSLVLQQHIRMHTGEPTDMHPEQIMANEVRQGHLLSTSFPRPAMPSLIPTFTSPSSLPPRSSPAGPPNICQIPKSEAPSLTPSPVRSASTPTESVIKTTLKQTDNQSMEDSSSPTTVGNNSRPPSAKQERCTTPQPPILTSNLSPNATSITSSPRISSPSMDKPIVTTAPYSPAYTTSLVALENHVKAINTTIPQTLPFSPFGMGLAMGSFFRYEDAGFMNRNPPKDLSRDKSPAPLQSYSPSPNTSRAASDASGDERSTPGSIVQSESPVSVNGNHMRLSSGVITTKVEGGALDLTPKNSIISVPPSVPDIQLFTSPLAGLPFPTTPGRLSTTCRICFKTFACNSALEIHYRSHTKERPFKCNVCDRGFTTKGNMKQHLLTHKSRDLQPLLFASTENSVPDSETNSSTNVTSPRTSSPVTTAFETNLSQTSNHTSEKKEIVMSSISTISTISTPPVLTTSAVTAVISTPTQVSPAIITSGPLPKQIKQENDGSSKRHLSDHISSTPPKQRNSGVPKHFCHICQKPFSSASALQIHNRTHSGEKPFKCVVCGRAFTTKGNLKVHMNTHMAQNNGNSRRGRRMSLEFQPPPPLPAHGKQEYPHHARPDLYFPYLPPGYINGIACPPKMNEISVIQTAAGITNGNISTPSTMNLTPAVSMMTPVMTLGQQQPFVRKQVQQSTDSDGSNYVDPRSPDEAENLKIQPSPSPPLESASPVRPIPSSPSTAADNAACWNWKTACNICNKICSSSSDLELHLKSHCNPVIHDTVRSASQTAKNLAS